VGNTMTNVSPTNLKLIGRATNLIRMHVNDVLSGEEWQDSHRCRDPVTYADANAVLFDVMPFVNERKAAGDQAASEVSLSIARILESCRQNRNVPAAEALELLKDGDLNAYLASVREEGRGDRK
jgi:hypothetical protein